MPEFAWCGFAILLDMAGVARVKGVKLLNGFLKGGIGHVYSIITGPFSGW